MRFLSKLISLINGTAPIPQKNSQGTIISDMRDVSTEKNNPVAIQDSTLSNHKKDYSGKKTAYNEPSSNVNKSENNRSESFHCKEEYDLDNPNLYSDISTVQRYEWHQLLIKIISDIEENPPIKIRFLIIYLKETDKHKYYWNDDTFRTELMQAIKQSESALSLGLESLNIEIVDEENFQTQSTLKKTDDIYLKQIGDIILVGSTKEINNQNKDLYSSSLPLQRYAWHQHLEKILSKIEEQDTAKLKYFTIYIKRIVGCQYQWNDNSFKSELIRALEKYDCASHIGVASFGIEVVNDLYFQKLYAQKETQSQYKKLHGDILLLGGKKETTEQKFATAIEKRAFVINEMIKKFRSSTGTDTKLMENLVIVVIRNEEDDDMAKYDWIGKRFEDDLKRELTNAFLEKIGSKSLQIILKPKSETEDCISLIDNQVYYRWGKADTTVDDKSKEIPYERVVATVSIIEGTGSMMKPSYILDSDKKKVYHIGRGITSRKGGKYRVNDIVIKDKEADSELLQCNGHVSSTHADIVFKNNRYYIKAAIGGCRAIGGSPTKVVRNEKATELRDTTLLYPLEDGDIIELGKNVLLMFSLSGEDITSNNYGETSSNNAMTVDDSF